ncbi:PPOX class F420-dependent oxidoreductase [Streptomyces fuscichromogenes]|uniref:PPOX class F420-dependent oxidoreductase n=1 Tax=Streptomyces fuscichromogenes TaxID=1324013 RepID=UPI0038213894
MTAAEIREFLGAGRTMTLGTHNADGSIHLAPMWYAVLDGQIVMWTYARSQKAVNLSRDARLTALVEDGEEYDALRGVQLTGRAELVTDPADVLGLGAAIHAKYHPGDTDAEAGVRRQAAKRVGIRLVADRTVSWDHRKLG